MEETNAIIQDAENFIRKALSHFPDANANNKTIKIAADKVSKSLPISPKKEEHQAA